jgi:PAS domain S-box-containing protein
MMQPLTELILDEALARSLIDQVPDGLMIADEDGRMRLVNRALEEMFGYNRAELLGRHLEILVPEALRARHGAHRLRYRAAPHRRPMGVGLELKGRRNDGSTFPIEISLSPWAGSSETLTIATVRDVSTRQESERRVRWVQRLLDATSDAVYVFATDDLTLLHVNAGAGRQTGYAIDQLVSMSPLHILPELPERRLRALLAPLADDRSPGVSFETTVRRADGTDVPVEVITELIAPEPDAAPVYVATARDISERVATQRALDSVRQRLAVAEDRERIARDLHDNVIQRLFATGLGLQSVAGQVDSATVRDRLAGAVDDLDQAIRDIRTSIFALHAPAAAVADGLRNGVLATAAEANRTLGFAPTIRFTGSVDAVDDVSIVEGLLATLREALSNVARHADATRVDIELMAGGRLTLVVRDDGIGVAGGTVRAGGHGLANMRQRAAHHNGEFTIGTVSPTGTELTWSVPLHGDGTAGHERRPAR